MKRKRNSEWPTPEIEAVLRASPNLKPCKRKYGRVPYDLRHTYASRAVMAGVDLPTLAALLGHMSIQMTMRYVHPAEEHKRGAAGKLENYKAAELLKLAEKNQRVSTLSTTMQAVN